MPPNKVVEPRPQRAGDEQVGAHRVRDGVGEEGNADHGPPGDPRARPTHAQPFDHAHQEEAEGRQRHGGGDTAVSPGGDRRADVGQAEMAELAP
jgi:hypothetical protein